MLTFLVQMKDFWCSKSIIDIDDKEKTWPLPEAKFHFNHHNSCGLRYEAEEVRRCIRNGQTESELVSHEDSLHFAEVED